MRAAKEMEMTETGWIEHDGKGLPVPEDTLVLVKYRNGVGSEYGPPSRAYRWGDGEVNSNWNHHYLSGSDIIAYKVVAQ